MQMNGPNDTMFQVKCEKANLLMASSGWGPPAGALEPGLGDLLKQHPAQFLRWTHDFPA